MSKAYEEFENGRYSLAQRYAAKAGDLDYQSLRNITSNQEEAKQNFTKLLASAIDEYKVNVKLGNSAAATDFETSVDDAMTYLTEECGVSAEDAKNVIIDYLSQIDHFDTTGLLAFAAATGLTLGDIMGDNMNSALAEKLNYAKSTVDSLNTGFGGVFSRVGGKLRQIAHSLHYFAAGGYLPSGEQGIIAEAGPELIQMQGRGIRITPLTNTARNTAISSGGVGRSIVQNITLNFPHDISISNGYDVRQFVEEATEMISENLRNLNIFETRAIGGTGI